MRPADPAEARAWDSRKAREYIGELREEFPNTFQALTIQMRAYENHAPGGLYGFVLELSVLADALRNR